jgi:nucleotide-binding universal stress UspA family protein
MEQHAGTAAPAPESADRPVIVGVDGSEGSRAALRFAIDEARRRGAPLRIVVAWLVPVSVYAGAPLPPDFPENCEIAARALADDALLTVGYPGDVPYEIVTRRGSPDTALLAEADDAAVLVVGSRGVGGFRELLLGSVSQACVHHATCPVIVVPHGRVPITR